MPEAGGGIPWRKQDLFFNAPANGPAGIFLARYPGGLPRATQMADWIDDTLIDPDTQLVFDGIKGARWSVPSTPTARGWWSAWRPNWRCAPATTATPAGCTGWSPRSARTWRRTACSRAPAGVTAACSPESLRATWRWPPPTCPATAAADERARGTARRIVLASAHAAWDNRCDRRRSSAVRRLLGSRRRSAGYRRTACPQGRRGRARLRRAGTRSVRSGLGMDADGGRAHPCGVAHPLPPVFGADGRERQVVTAVRWR